MVQNDCIIVYDTDVVAINRSKKENQSDSIIYKDNEGDLHTIELDMCAKNYSELAGYESNCVGGRKIDEYYILLYTSGLLTKIVFSKFFVFRPTRFLGLSGTRNARFLKFISLLNETKYRTRDLS